ncbi:MAG: hypothetical protein FWF50_02440, partial [Defluviitaleaceae bacterium]|nr:hypothetical protein [Defluviitaleaceae bacterium]
EHLISLGAATIAKTNRLDLVQIEKPSINFDIGIFVDVVKELEKTRAFYPLIQSGQINQHETYRVNIIADLTSDFKFNLYKDSPDQKEPAILKTIKIPNLHKPEYAGALEVCLNINNNILNIKVIDKSFKNPKGVVFTDSMQLI